MKKFLSVLASMAVIGSMTCGVFADTKDGGPTASGSTPSTFGEVTSTQTINVSATIGNGEKVYNVVVEWTSMEFTYEGGTWDPSKHVYKEDGKWDENTHKITVYNHSNAAVDVKAAVTTDTADDGIVLKVNDTTATTGTTLKDASIEGIYGDYSKAEKVEYTVSASVDTTTGLLVPASDTPYAIGVITVTIADSN